MNKGELISAIVEKSDVTVTKKQAEAILNAFQNAVTAELKKGGKVTMIGFGTFEAKKRPARKGHNPATGAVIDIPACTVPSFKAGSSFRDALN